VDDLKTWKVGWLRALRRFIFVYHEVTAVGLAEIFGQFRTTRKVLLAASRDDSSLRTQLRHSPLRFRGGFADLS
jgi:hypothetical protein